MARKKPSSVEHLLNEERRFVPSETLRKKSLISSPQVYEDLYRRSLEDSETFWLEQANTLEWFRKPTIACRYHWDVEKGQIAHSWFEDGEINVSVNCLDRHLADKAHKTALLWQGEKDHDTRSLTYLQLYHAVCRLANVLKDLGVRKGDRICIYMPMIPELAISLLACARIGALHSVVFGGFSSEALAHRIQDSNSSILITAAEGYRGGKQIPIKKIVDEALEQCPSIRHCLVVKEEHQTCSITHPRDLLYHDLTRQAAEICAPEPLKAEDPLFILYTSGSTGKPKGVLHTQAGYLLHTALTHRYLFDLRDEDIYFCTADIGWVTGHSYIVYGPLANGATTLMFEGIPTYPNPGRFWQIVEKYKVTLFYTAPTAIRSLIRHGEEWPQCHDLTSLRLLGTVGEPINPEAWVWYHQIIGQGKCPVIDTWWQTETGGIMISPFPGIDTLKPGSAGRPFFGVDPVILRDDGTECSVNEGGSLCLRRPWPGMLRTTWGDHKRMVETYFSPFSNLYFTGDGCRRDEEGDFWLMGRIDDVVNISGHRLGTAEVESALVSHEAVAEAAVVPIPHAIKGQAIHVYVTLVDSAEPSKSLHDELVQHIRYEIGPIATPEKLQFAKALPKTRSGKIMRRLLRKIACGEIDNLGDTTTLADAGVLEDLLYDEEA